LAITKERKDELVAQYVELLDRTNGFVIIESRGMSVPTIDRLRAKVREASGYYVVTKNTLFTKALQQRGWPVPDDFLKGPTAIAFGLENFPAVAKAVLDFTNDRDNVEKTRVKGGVMTGQIIDASKVDMISNLPSLDALRAQLAGVIVQPAAGLVSVINVATGQVVNVLDAYVREKGGDAA
jgi:large subunit ribosomal protein L10